MKVRFLFEEEGFSDFYYETEMPCVPRIGETINFNDSLAHKIGREFEQFCANYMKHNNCSYSELYEDNMSLVSHFTGFDKCSNFVDCAEKKGLNNMCEADTLYNVNDVSYVFGYNGFEYVEINLKEMD